MALLAVCGAMIAWTLRTPAAGVVERARAASIVADVKSKVIGALNATIALKKAGKRVPLDGRERITPATARLP